MDRGRVGTLAIGNKTIRDQMIAHQQEVHLERGYGHNESLSSGLALWRLY